jgi:hypothetical protein
VAELTADLMWGLQRGTSTQAQFLVLGLQHLEVVLHPLDLQVFHLLFVLQLSLFF